MIKHSVAISYSRADMTELQSKIAQAKQDVADGHAKVSALEARNAASQAKVEQLEKDAESVAFLKEEAILGRHKLQRRFSAVGGHEDTLKVLVAALAETKAEVARLRQEKAYLASGRRDTEKELAGLQSALAKSQAKSESYKQEYNQVVAKQHDVEAKLHQIATFLTATT
ncbi:hypothetical protein SPRG_06359 [Saprolegnia parasitica CBS 223.65]|uniref:Uncharacterized protein n=1 Tax=Saprolegnia parasitica (strain CBS 223.65) TaxID=695850 RepID=A0A067CC25_SAPPC|nr:hypothetical protein SPRG_06359 [Saprolegnia parasitica CBS 223.65]KDO28309.1 hypothetical protein SPRG_06359 [Saprolegnia parasitica CBS 223.65]|eukprot:XP_012201128.1 hypothetical protein SPRG_06359 [Saprolegnia parasitica CBS 223.65]